MIGTNTMNTKLTSMRLGDKALKLIDDLADELEYPNRAQAIMYAVKLTTQLFEETKNGVLVIENEDGTKQKLIIVR
jgi:Arc/MetJ-type ribon-helix-helix transcriptional regulator